MTIDELQKRIEDLEITNLYLTSILAFNSPNPRLIIDTLKAFGEDKNYANYPSLTPRAINHILSIAEITENVLNKQPGVIPSPQEKSR